MKNLCETASKITQVCEISHIKKKKHKKIAKKGALFFSIESSLPHFYS
jgi:hypothetical protein